VIGSVKNAITLTQWARPHIHPQAELYRNDTLSPVQHVRYIFFQPATPAAAVFFHLIRMPGIC